MICNSRRAGPRGLISPRSHLLSVPVDTDNNRANTAWLICACSRIAMICLLETATAPGSASGPNIRTVIFSTVFGSINPTVPKSRADSTISARIRAWPFDSLELLPSGILVTSHLSQFFFRDRNINRLIITFKPGCAHFPPALQLVKADIISLTLGKPKNEHGPCANTIGNHCPIACTSTLPWPRNPLLDQSLSEIGINQTSLGPGYSVAESLIADSLAPLELAEHLRSKDAHWPRFPT